MPPLLLTPLLLPPPEPLVEPEDLPRALLIPLTTMMEPPMLPTRPPIRLPLLPTRPLLMPRTRLKTRWFTIKLLRTELDGITKPLLLPRTPLMPTRLPTEPELPMRRINSSEDKTRTETRNSVRTTEPKCPESRTSTTRERPPTPDSRRPSPEHDQREAANARLK